MAYLTSLKWMEHLAEFAPDEQKVLLALSNEKYKWRSRERLIEVTGFDGRHLDPILSGLISRDLVRPSISKKKKVIFGLKERVGSR